MQKNHLLLALLTAPDLAQLASRGSRLLAGLPVDELRHHFDRLTAGSAETMAAVGAGADAVALATSWSRSFTLVRNAGSENKKGRPQVTTFES